MKHNLKIIVSLVAIFLIAQFIGLLILTQYIDIKTTSETGKTQINSDVYGVTGIMPPEVQQESLSFIWILLSVLFGTGLVLLIVKFRKRNLWKVWFSLSVMLALVMAFAPFAAKFFARFLPGYQNYVIWAIVVLAMLLTYYKIFKKSIFIHNFTEIFIYGGLASILVPVINLISSTILLLLISVYDIYAVWHSKHMVTMAEFQTKDRVFAGLLIPYKRAEKEEEGSKPVTEINAGIKAQKSLKQTPEKTETKDAMKGEEADEQKNAILGGGDIAFPLLFAGAVMKYTGSIMLALIISVCAAVALFFIYYFGQKDRYYPAMPFISAGCFVGAGIVWLVTLI